MARGRMISKTLGTSSRKFARLREFDAGLFAQALYPLLVASSDDFGRQQADPFTVKHSVWSTAPETETTFSAALNALRDVDLILLYGVAGCHFLQIVDFEEHQQGLHKRTASKYPNPPDIPGDSLLTELNRTELKGTELVKSSEASSEPAFLEFPVIGTGNSVWQLSEAQVAEWAGLFPGLDVRSETRKALAWVQANTGRRKTERGMPRFLVAWLSRVVDSGQSRPFDESSRQQAWACPHQPPCGKTAWQCHQDARLEEARRRRVGKAST